MRTAVRTVRAGILTLGMAAAATCALAAGPAPAAAPEAAIRDDFQGARWPADIVRAATRYLTLHPAGPASEAARSELDRARSTTRLLERSDIRLYRADFTGDGAPPPIAEDIRKAALADKEAALRVAHHHREGARADAGHYIGWLQYSAALGNAAGSYELALHYRKDNQPALAAPYEARAEELGFKIPAALDNIRK